MVDVTADTILNDLVNNTQGLNSTNAQFGVRIRDTRSGFDVVNNNYYSRMITRVAPSGTTCAEGGVACAFVNVALPVGIDDPTFRRDSVAVFGTTGGLTATSPGYYNYFALATDRAGNVSPTVSRRASIDVAAPMITGINFPASLPGASNVAFVPNGSDDLEVISGALYLNYPNMAGGPLRYAMYPQVHAPWLATSAATLATPVGNGAAFGAAGFTVPHGFLNGIDVVSGVDSTPPVAVSGTYAPTAVLAQFYDIKREEATLAGATPDSSGTFRGCHPAGADPHGRDSVPGGWCWTVVHQGMRRHFGYFDPVGSPDEHCDHQPTVPAGRVLPASRRFVAVPRDDGRSAGNEPDDLRPGFEPVLDLHQPDVHAGAGER